MLAIPGAFKGGVRVVTEWTTRRRCREKAALGRPSVPPSARKLSHLITTHREQLTKAEAVTMAAIETGVPALATACTVLDHFHRMLRTRDTVVLTPWMAGSKTSLLASFCKGLKADPAAVIAALTEPWGRTDGQRDRSPRLKLVKRQMYGRRWLDLLRAWLVDAG